MRLFVVIAACLVASVAGAQVQTFDVRYVGEHCPGVEAAPISDAWLTANGLYLTFRTARADLRSNDLPNTVDAFASYLPLQRPIWLSKPLAEGLLSIGSGPTRISEDGRIAVWEQTANESTGRPGGVFLRNRDTDVTSLASVNDIGAALPNATLRGFSSDGRYSLVSTLNEIWRYDFATQTGTRLATSPTTLYTAALSPAGDTVAYSNADGVWFASASGTMQILNEPGSSARVLAVGDGRGAVVFCTSSSLVVNDRDTTDDLYEWTFSGFRLIDLGISYGTVEPIVSANRRWAAFVQNLDNGRLVRVDMTNGGKWYGQYANRLDKVTSISDDGRQITRVPYLPGSPLIEFPTGANLPIVTGSGVAPLRTEGGIWSRSGRFALVWEGANSTLSVRDAELGRSATVPQATGWTPVGISDNGRYVLVQQPGSTRWIDRKSGAIRTLETQGSADLSPNGGYIAANVLEGGKPVLRLVVAETGATRVIVRKTDGSPSTQAIATPTFTADGSRVLFSTSATDLSCGSQSHPDPEMPSYSLVEYRLDTRALNLIRIGRDAKDGIEGIASDASGRRVAILQGDINADYFITIVVRDRLTGEERTLPGTFPQYRELALSPDGAYLTTVGIGGAQETPIFHRLATRQWGTGFPIKGGSGNVTALRLFDNTRTLRCFLDGYPLSYRFEFPISP